MLSKRLKKITLLVDSNKIINIGTDHALLEIYLTINNHIKCIGSDINDSSIQKSLDNIRKYNLQDQIEIIKSNGLQNIPINDETVIISGLGARTIIDILNNPKVDKINTLIIQSNNDLEFLRRSICKKGFYIDLEETIYDNKIWYVIIRFKRGYKKYNSFMLYKGPTIKENEYLNHLLKMNIKELEKIPKREFVRKIKKRLLIYKLKKEVKK